MTRVLADSSAWIEFFRGTGSDVHQRVRTLVRDDRLATTDVIRMELLAGARGRAGHSTDAALNRCLHVPVRPLFDYEAAALLYRRCRSRGVTPRQLTDCLIAIVAIHHDMPLLAADRDFEAIASVSPLRLA